MKILLFIVTALVTVTSALSAQAADRKLGNLILVERDIENIYTGCLKTISQSIKTAKNNEVKKYYFCTIQITQNPAEVLVNHGTAFFTRGPECQVDSEFGNGKLLISFSTDKKDASPEDAKRCLRKTLDANTDVVAMIQTIE